MTIGTFVVRFCCISKCKSCKFATKETRCNSIYNIQIDKRILNAGKISNFCRILCFHSKWGCQGSLEICLWVKFKTLSTKDVILYISNFIHNKWYLECYQFMTYYTVREIVLPCITYDERMHFQVVIKGVNAIYQSKSNEYNESSKIQ